jgi:hypothetical protein
VVQWLQPAAQLSALGDGDERDGEDGEPGRYANVRLRCDCEDFANHGGICKCVLYVAAVVLEKTQPLSALLTKITNGRNGSGRKRKAQGPESDPHSAAFYESKLKTNTGTYYHRWQVLKQFGGTWHVGTIVTFRDDHGTTPHTRLWQVRYLDDPNNDNNTEEHTAAALAKLLHNMAQHGHAGPSVADSHSQPMRNLPAAAALPPSLPAPQQQ